MPRASGGLGEERLFGFGLEFFVELENSKVKGVSRVALAPT